MKGIHIIISLYAVSSSLLYSAVGFNTFFGVTLSSSGSILPDGTLWALVVDSDDDNVFAGFGLDDNLYEQNIATPGVADTYFTSGQTISLGSNVGGGTVFALGGLNDGAGGTSDALSGLALGVNGLADGREFAFYWFPDATFSGVESDPQTISDEVGGIQNNTTDVGVFFDTGMVVPSDGSPALGVGAASISAGASLPNDNFRAVALIPEPSTALMGAFGALALLRRRRVTQA